MQQQRRHPMLRTWLLLTALIFGVQLTWVLAEPLFAGADEPVQIVKAAAVVRGELVGTPVGPSRATTQVRVPAAYAKAWTQPFCWFLQPSVPASCASTFPSTNIPPQRLTDATTYVGRYPPLYYAIVGWPSLFFASATGVYLMRSTGALACACLLAIALLVASRSESSERLHRFLVVGVLVAATPTVLFTSSVVNPNGLEAAGAIALWTCLIRLATEPGPPRRHLVVLTTVSAAVTVWMRGLSPFWVACTVLVCSLFAGHSRLARLLADRRVRRAGLLVAVISAGATAWIVLVGSLDLMGVACRVGCPGFWGRASTVLSLTGNYLRQVVGIFGWVTTSTRSTAADTSAPLFTFLIWGLVAIALVFLALRSSFSRAAAVHSPLREGLALAFCAAGVVVIPVLIQGSEANSLGLVWQGRYVLPLAVGVPLVAAAVWERFHVSPRATGILLGGLWVGQLGALWWAMRRWAVGTSGPLWFIGRASWSPPIASVILVAAAGLLLGVLSVWARHAVFADD